MTNLKKPLEGETYWNQAVDLALRAAAIAAIFFSSLSLPLLAGMYAAGSLLGRLATIPSNNDPVDDDFYNQVDRIQTNFDLVSKDLALLVGSRGEQLRNDLGKVWPDYERVKAQNSQNTHCLGLENVQEGLRLIRGFLENYGLMRAQSAIPFAIQPQRMDGNCWLNASLWSLGELGDQELPDADGLRQQVVGYMIQHQNDPEMKKLLLGSEDGLEEGALATYKAVTLARLAEEESSLTEELYEEELPQAKENHARSVREAENLTLDGYFQMMRQNGSHGSRAEFYAISQMYQATILVWRECRDREGQLTIASDAPILYSERNERYIRVILNRYGNHFDSVAGAIAND